MTNAPPAQPDATPPDPAGGLLPCPFCGGIASLERGYKSDDTQVFYGRCRDCAARCENRYTRADAIAAWNRRAPPAPAAEPAAEGAAVAPAALLSAIDHALDRCWFEEADVWCFHGDDIRALIKAAEEFRPPPAAAAPGEDLR